MKTLVIDSHCFKSLFNNINKLGKRNFIITFLIFTFSSLGYGQNSKVISTKEYLTTLSASKSNSSSDKAEVLKSFLQDLKPSVYIESNEIKVKENNPVCLYTDTKSISYLNSLNSFNNTIEYISIKVSSKNDIMSPIDLSYFKRFTKLKYIVIEFEYNINQQAVQTCLTNMTETLLVLYKVELPS